jgi:hypothetical protein
MPVRCVWDDFTQLWIVTGSVCYNIVLHHSIPFGLFNQGNIMHGEWWNAIVESRVLLLNMERLRKDRTYLTLLAEVRKKRKVWH